MCVGRVRSQSGILRDAEQLNRPAVCGDVAPCCRLPASRTLNCKRCFASCCMQRKVCRQGSMHCVFRLVWRGRQHGDNRILPCKRIWQGELELVLCDTLQCVNHSNMQGQRQLPCNRSWCSQQAWLASRASPPRGPLSVNCWTSACHEIRHTAASDRH
jgi:hypothetical protein